MLEAEGVEFVFAPDERTLYPEPQTYRVRPPPMANEPRTGSLNHSAHQCMV